jgi:RNA-directed DNA polymerase
MTDAQTLGTMSPGRFTGVERAKKDPEGRCNTLAHLRDVPALTRASRRQRADAAVGGDDVTKEAYGRNREANLQDLHARLKTKRSRHQPIRRGHLPKAQGTTRPLGLSACEATVVPDAVREGLAAMDAQDCRDGAHGLRPGRSAHGAIRPLHRIVKAGEGRWILEADLGSCFDSVARTTLKERRSMRVAEGSLGRLMGKWLHVGGRDGTALSEPGRGSAQGAVRAPVLGNVSLHDGLDLWCETAVKPRLQGTAPLMRSCDDVISGCEREDDARRVGAVLDKRMGRCGLALHPAKTRLVPCWRPPKSQPRGKGPATFEFVGFTGYWTRSRQGNGWMTCTTRRASFRRAKVAIDDWCRRHRHRSIKEQHAALYRRVRGHCNSFGVRGNSTSGMRRVADTKRAWYKGWCRRSQRTRLNWERCSERLRWWPLPRPRITVRMWDGSPRATSTEEPDGGNLLVRLWRGAGRGEPPGLLYKAFFTQPQ